MPGVTKSRMAKRICGICLLEKTPLNALDAFYHNGKLDNYRTMIQQTFNITLLQDKDNLICDSCIMQVRKANDMKRLALKSNNFMPNLNNNYQEGDSSNGETGQEVSSSENGNNDVPPLPETTQIKTEEMTGDDDVVSSEKDDKDVPETKRMKLEPEESTSATTEPGKTVVTKYVIKPTTSRESDLEYNFDENFCDFELDEVKEGTDSAKNHDTEVIEKKNLSKYRAYYKLREESIPCLIDGKQMRKAAKEFKRKIGGNQYQVVCELKVKKNKK